MPIETILVNFFATPALEQVYELVEKFFNLKRLKKSPFFGELNPKESALLGDLCHS